MDIATLRRDTPGLTRRIHLNHAGASPSPTPVLDRVVEHLRLEAELGGYEAADACADEFDGVHGSVARLLGCAPDEVALCDSASSAWHRAFWSLPLRSGDTVLTCRSEYVTNAMALWRAERTLGVVVEVLPDDSDGQVDVDALSARLERGGVALVSLVHVPTQGGLVNPAAEVGARCRAAGVPLLLDACQSAGQLPLDVEAIGCDLLTATGRKYLRGPRGTGFLYVRRDLLDRLDPLLLDGRSATWSGERSYTLAPGAQRFESFERNWAGLLGLGRAVDYALDLGVDRIAERVVRLGARLRDALDDLDGVQVHDRGAQRCGIVTFTVSGRPAAEVRESLAGHGVQVANSEVVHARLDLAARGIDSMVRASVHVTTTEEELDRTVELVDALSRGGA
ncbi:MAG: aminotransferase class V-fold PLP-dependent enzyme [Microthrixaceae bacterium]